MENYEEMSLVELRLAAKNLGIKNVTTYKKSQLLEKIMSEESAKTATEKTETKNNSNNKNNRQQMQKGRKTQNVKAQDNREKSQQKQNVQVMESENFEPVEMEQLDSGEIKEGILEVLSEGYGFIRCDNYLPGDGDVYVSPTLIRKYHLRTGDILRGNVRIRNQNEKFGALLFIKTVNGVTPDKIIRRVKFENLTPVFPNERIRLESQQGSISMRMMDLIAPIGKGQRGMIVSQPKTGKTTLLKQVANAVKTNHPKMHLIVLLIDERPEEVTDIKESIMGHNVDVK